MAASAEQVAGTLKGQVTDESGALVPGAKVSATAPGGVVKVTTSGNDGSYTITGLQPGKYNVQASSPGLSQFQPAVVDISGGVATLNLQLKVVLEKQEVTVQENTGPTVSTDASSNAGALVLRGEDLQALSDDPDDLQADLQALAGPAAGPNGGQIYIDGFTGGQLPSKDSIREIRINQNPFSPEYDRIGFGRIEILTKPGTDKFRGQAYFNYGNDIFNSRNPYARQKAPLDLKEFGGNLSGPLSKKASFFVDVDRRMIDNGAVINATTLDPSTLGIIDPYTQVFLTPFRRLRVSPRVDYQLNPSNTLTVRYGFTRNDVTDSGIGNFNLTSRGVNTLTQDHTVQVTETAVLSAKIINETRFQYLHQSNIQNAINNTPSINVLSSFNGGGAQIGHGLNDENHYEIQNYTSIAAGAHAWKFGVRLRAVSLENISPQNFGGTFSFGGGYAPILDANNQAVLPGVICDSRAQTAGCATITSIQRYQRTLLFQKMGLSPDQIRLLGGGATQFSINAGNPLANVGQVDAGIFVGDDWRLRPNFTLSLGLRYETQTNIHDWHDFAPRIGFAWAPGGSAKGAMRPKTVVRGGFGIFYDRFSENNVLTAQRYNGVNQQQYVVINPNFFPLIPSPDSLQQFAKSQTVHEISSQLQAPYIVQSAIGVERQIPGNTTIALTYTNSHAVHMLRSRNINAPLPGTYTGVPGSGVFPYGNVGPIFLVESAGTYNQNQLITNVNSRVNRNVSLFGFYMLNFARSNTDGVNTFPANQYDLNGEYGPASTDVRHRGVIGGSLATKWDLRLSPFITMQSGAPFDITAGQDLFGDTLFTGRPGIATDPNKPGVVSTPYGLLDPNPSPGEKILPRNFGRGPSQYTVNLRLAKTFGFGPAREGSGNSRRDFGGGRGPGGDHGGPGGGGHGPGGPAGGMRMGGGGMGGMGGGSTNRRYNLTLSISARNLLNHNNPGQIIGNITSPIFGRANSLAGGFGAFSENGNNRRVELQMRFTF
jgi:hypothetical protein